MRQQRICSLVAPLLLLAPACARSQTLSSWRGIEELRPGQYLSCVLTDQSHVAGRLRSADASEMIVVAEGHRVLRIEKERVRSVLVRRRPRGNKVMWIGLVAGAATGLAFGAAGSSHTAGGRVALAGAGAAMFAPVGLGIGALLRGRPEDVVVYRAPERTER